VDGGGGSVALLGLVCVASNAAGVGDVDGMVAEDFSLGAFIGADADVGLAAGVGGEIMSSTLPFISSTLPHPVVLMTSNIVNNIISTIVTFFIQSISCQYPSNHGEPSNIYYLSFFARQLPCYQPFYLGTCLYLNH